MSGSSPIGKRGSGVRSLCAFALMAGVAVFVACSSSEDGGDGSCKPGAILLCHCENGEGGSKSCKDDGSGFGACEPCNGAGGSDGGKSDSGGTDSGSGEGGPSQCGNGRIDQGEACDDRNTVDGDGCSAQCQPDGNPLTAGECPGQAIHIWSQPVVYAFTTQAYTAAHKSKASCGGTQGNLSADRVFAVSPHGGATLVVSVTSAAFDHMLYARTACADEMAELDCVNASSSAAGETLRVPIGGAQTIWVFVDGTGPVPTAGDITVSFSTE